MIPDYAMRKTRTTDSLALGVALPATRTCPHANGEVLESAIRTLLNLKRPADRWGILRYGMPVSGDPARPRPADVNALPPCTLTPETDALIACLGDPENRSGYAEAVQALLNDVAQSNGSRNLVLTEDRSQGSTLPEIAPSRMALLVKDAQAASVAINAMVLTADGCQPPATLAAACEQTGGICLSTSNLNRLPDLSEELHFGLVHPYEIQYRPLEDAAPGPLKLQVYCGQGAGENTLDAPSPPQ
jgi:hypothetical protein